MVPLSSSPRVSGIPITQLMDRTTLDAIVGRPPTGGAAIGRHLETGSASYEPSSRAVQEVEALVRDQTRIRPCAAWPEAGYAMRDISLGVPCNLGRRGLEQVLEVELTPKERGDLGRSADAVLEPMPALTV